jgi:2-C-methyl-D-erythritol 2,4-cyclodiphosphate synthase
MSFRIGHGYDIHRLQNDGKLILGGVLVSTEISPIAHSDGDVVIHAIVDALLGAMGWGDIGVYFPVAQVPKNADSRYFLETVYKRVKSSGCKLVNVDVSIIAERPKLATFREQIVKTLSQMFAGDGLVNIKAGTNEETDAVGRGEAIVAHAVVLLSSPD